MTTEQPLGQGIGEAGLARAWAAAPQLGLGGEEGGVHSLGRGPGKAPSFQATDRGRRAEGELKPGAPLLEQPPEPGLALLGPEGCSGKSCEAPELGLASAGIGFLPLPGFTLGGAQSTLIVPIPQTEGEAEWRQLSSRAQNWSTVLVQGCGSKQ